MFTGSQLKTLSLWASCTESSVLLTETSVSHKETTGFRTGTHLNGTGYGNGEERQCCLQQNRMWQQNAAKTHKRKKIPHSITTSITLQPLLYQLLRCLVIDMIDFFKFTGFASIWVKNGHPN